MFTKQTIKDIDLKNKVVLLRTDYNVPLDNGKITDDYRIKQSLPTIEYLLSKNTKIIICSHLGRPEGKTVNSLSLKPVEERLGKLLDKKVDFSDSKIGPKLTQQLVELKPKQIILLENLRFYPEEEANDKDFAKNLASLADVFVQDAFGVVHRAHASTDAITKYIPSVAGLLLAKEVDTLTDVIYNPTKPLTVIIGGAKIDDKLDIINTFIKKADFLAIGGALANPFLAAKKIDIEASLFKKSELKLAKEILNLSEEENKKRNLVFAVPHDVVVASQVSKTTKTRVVDFTSGSFADVAFYPHRVSAYTSKLKSHEKILDIGPFSASFIAGAVQLSKTVLWNGTMGVTEVQGLQGPIGPFSHGTQTVIEAIVGDLGFRPYSVVGGGDTIGYLETRGLVNSFDHVSTGGGASMELLSGHKLPGVEALLDKNEVQ
ncbi:MAG TPA: phosphoglycerate kinase [Patescibacteria group bacterium]|nr:phosphoglycerate kinase [Patescibacteria group bacterium]